jgi:integrating conjugative element membrane protein (TIGR03745 family)
VAAVGLLAAVHAQVALAELPTAVPPSTGDPGDNWIDLVKGYIKDGGLVLGLALGIVAFLWVSWNAIHKFNEARTGKAEWGEVGLLTIVGGAVLIFIAFLLNEAATVIE